MKNIFKKILNGSSEYPNEFQLPNNLTTKEGFSIVAEMVGPRVGQNAKTAQQKASYAKSINIACIMSEWNQTS